MVTRLNRPPRRIFMNGKLLNGGDKTPVSSKATATEFKPTSKRPPITTPDGRMNEVAAAAYLGRAVSTLQNWRSMGQPPHYLKEHGRIFYRLSDLDTFRSN